MAGVGRELVGTAQRVVGGIVEANQADWRVAVDRKVLLNKAIGGGRDLHTLVY